MRRKITIAIASLAVLGGTVAPAIAMTAAPAAPAAAAPAGTYHWE